MTRKQTPEFVLLQAKLNRPRVTKDLIVRPRLLALLDAGLSEPLSIVVAPAGFGKTTLVSSWIEELAAGQRHGIVPVLSAWLSLDKSDSDLNVFLRYFVSAMRTIFPEAAPKTLELLSARLPPLDELANILSNEIEALPSNFIMALDDAHLLSGRSVFDFLAAWTRHWPRPIHVVLISRLSPSLPLTSLRARGKLIEVRSRELRFTKNETAEYLGQRLGSAVEEPDLATIHQLMEGWVVGLKLATHSPVALDRPAALPPDVLSGQAYAADYLIDEVLLRQSADIQTFLLKISITGQFCVSLCEALLGDEAPACDIRTCLNFLETNELFLIALDNRQEWYRLHNLFRDLLLRRLRLELDQEAVDALHGRAARWYARQGLLDQALYHAMEGKNLELAAEFMWQGMRDVLNRSDRPMLERWLKMLPEELIARQPRLLVMRAFYHALRWEMAQVQRTVEQVEELLAEHTTAAMDEDVILQGLLATLKGHGAYSVAQPAMAVTYSREALALMPPEWSYVRGVAGMYLGAGLYMTGQGAEAERTLTTYYEAAANKTDEYALRLLQGLAINALQSGRFETVERTAKVMLRQSDSTGLPLSQGWAHYFLGYTRYHWNDMAAAERHFAAVLDLRYTTQMLVVRQSFSGIAAVFQARGDFAKAMAWIDELSQVDLELYGQETMHTAAARARVLLRHGDLDGADMWSEQVTLPPSPQPLLPWADEPLLTRIGTLIARNTPADNTAALEALDALDEVALHTFSPRPRVEILALRALAQMAHGDVVAAWQSLIQSVELARRTGHIRVYVDLGLPMQKLMGQVAGHRTISTAAAGILAAFEPTGGNGQFAASRRVTTAEDPALSEALTTRELEILMLMVEPISLVQIADQLNIARGTVKRHSINLYEKLGVHTRWEAVARAVELGILPPR